MEELVNDESQADLGNKRNVRSRVLAQDDTWMDSEGNFRPIVGPLRPLIDFVAGIDASVHAKLVGGFFVGTLLLLGLFILSAIVVDRMSRQVNELNRAQAKLDLARQMEYLVTAQSHFRAMALLTNDDSNNDKIAAAKAKFTEDMIAMENLSPEQVDHLSVIKEIDDRYANLDDRVLALYEDGKIDEAMELHLTAEHAVSHELEGALRQLISGNTLQMTEVISSFRSNQGGIEVMLVTFSLVSLVIVLLVGFVLSWSFIRPVWKIDRVLDKIAKGDFSHEVNVPNRDEFGTLSGNINKMSQQLQRLYGELQIELAERKRLTETLEHRGHELAAANQELESFSYSVSHDLRAPLRGMDGFSQALLEDYSQNLDEGGQDYLRRIRTASQRMGELIDDLLTLSRVARTEMNRDQVNMSALAQSVAEDLRDTYPDRNFDFRCVDGVVASGDSHLLRVVMQNLIGNAGKYTGRRPDATVEFGQQTDGDGTAYFVRDNGAGFDMAYIDKLFNPFQRLHPSSEFEGTGIGLATVRRIVNRHGGKVWAESVVNEGATFYFTLG